MKKLIAVLIALTLLFCSCAFADMLSDIQAKGKLVIATEGTWQPWTYHDNVDGKDTLMGFDIEVAAAIAEKLGVEPEFIDVTWDGILAGVSSGRYDIAANGIDYSDERAEKYDFTVPYAYMRTAVIVRENDDSITCMEDLKGKKTANTLQSTYAIIGEKYGADVTGVDDLVETIELLKSGRIDATINAEMTFYDYIKMQPDAGIKIAALDYDSTSIVIPVRKTDDNASFVKALSNAIEELRAEGTLAEISVKYFGVDVTNPQ